MSDPKKIIEVDSVDDPLALLSMLLRVVSGWRVLFYAVLASILFTLIYLSMQEHRFTSRLVVTATDEDEASKGMGQFSSLASMAGISLQSSGEGGFLKYESVLISIESMERLLEQKPEYLKEVFKAEWDESSEKWSRPGGVKNSIKGLLRPILSLPGWTEPSAERLERSLKGQISVKKNLDTGFLTIMYEHPNSEFASRLLMDIHRNADELIRERERTRARQRLEYLAVALGKTTVANQREVLIHLLSDEQQKMMMIESDDAYIAEIIHHPVASRIVSSPKPISSLMLAILFGIVVGAIGIFVLNLDRVPVFGLRYLVVEPRDD